MDINLAVVSHEIRTCKVKGVEIIIGEDSGSDGDIDVRVTPQLKKTGGSNNNDDKLDQDSDYEVDDVHQV